MGRLRYLLLCLVMLGMTAISNAQTQAGALIAYNGTLPGANCFIHCASSCYCQAIATGPLGCVTAATDCCSRTGCNGIGDFTYDATPSPGGGPSTPGGTAGTDAGAGS